jgi:hypothetical protein
MKHIQRFKLYEKSLADAKEELKEFQDELDIDTTIRDLVESVDALEVELDSIFPFLNGDEEIDDLYDNSKFIEELEERDLKTSELFNSEDFNTFARLPVKWIWIYEKDSNDMEMPVFVMLQYYDGENWIEPRMFYVQKDVSNFLEELSQITLEIRDKKSDKKWIYLTSNSGEDWILQNTDDATSTFKPNIDWDSVVMLSQHSQVELVFY